VAVLKVLKGSCPGQIRDLHGEKTVFGRHPNCQIVLDNAAVSRHHAQILESHGHFYLEDLRSRNGTQLNGAPVDGRFELREADKITVCGFVFRFHFEMPPAEGLSTESALLVADRVKVNQAKTNQATVISKTDDLINIDGVDASDSAGQSSIISVLDASSASDLRLSVNPELKLRAIVEISKSLGQVLELTEVLDKILVGLFKSFAQADEGFVVLRDAKTGEFSIKASKTRRGENADAGHISMTIMTQVLEKGDGVLSDDASEDSRFKNSESVADLKIRSVICAPLLSQSDGALGVIQISTSNRRTQFSQDDLDLLISVATQARLAIENASLHQANMQQRDLERELEFAQQVQLGFLPSKRPKLADYLFYDYYEAAHHIGGDYFDYVTIFDRTVSNVSKVAIACADVAGKGLAAALLMVRLKSLAPNQLQTQPNVESAMTALNRDVATCGLGHRFITCVMAVIDPQKHEVYLANAGHPSPIRRDIEGFVQAVGHQQSGMPLGIQPDQQFREVRMKIEPGDTWLFYTDGVTEAMTVDGEIYGIQRLQDYIARGPDDLEQLVKGIVTDVEEFSSDAQQHDDMCIVCFQRNP